jgi:hypothetical protein
MTSCLGILRPCASFADITLSARREVPLLTQSILFGSSVAILEDGSFAIGSSEIVGEDPRQQLEQFRVQFFTDARSRGLLPPTLVMETNLGFLRLAINGSGHGVLIWSERAHEDELYTGYMSFVTVTATANATAEGGDRGK